MMLAAVLLAAATASAATPASPSPSPRPPPPRIEATLILSGPGSWHLDVLDSGDLAGSVSAEGEFQGRLDGAQEQALDALVAALPQCEAPCYYGKMDGPILSLRVQRGATRLRYFVGGLDDQEAADAQVRAVARLAAFLGEVPPKDSAALRPASWLAAALAPPKP